MSNEEIDFAVVVVVVFGGFLFLDRSSQKFHFPVRHEKIFFFFKHETKIEVFVLNFKLKVWILVFNVKIFSFILKDKNSFLHCEMSKFDLIRALVIGLPQPVIQENTHTHTQKYISSIIDFKRILI